MRFYADGPAIPDTLLERCDAGRVVFLCGAGVSQPSGMPSFVGLTQHVIKFFDPPDGSEIMTAFQPWLEDASAVNVPLDQIFNLLHQEYGRNEVNALVTKRLSAPLEAEVAGHKHDLIKRVSSNQSGVPQIVTTNFDLLFEVGHEGPQLDLHEPPAFPDLDFGLGIEGITYLHGRLVEPNSEHHDYVLSSADFGRAYLSEGWATNFIRSLLGRYTVVLVGYQAEDPPIKYLLQGLNHDGKFDRSQLYAFDQGLPEKIETKWRDRGVTAIAYAEHADLWKTMEAWADRADDPRQWRSIIVAGCDRDPKDLAPHERGQVANVLRTVPGARSFSEVDPAPHPEWICVVDANIRSVKRSSGYDDAETFDPQAAYGLDDDIVGISEDDRKPGVSNDNILAWRDQDDNPHDLHRLGGRQAEGFEETPKRLGHLSNWISKSLHHPVIAWWAIRQNGMHPRLLKLIKWELERSEGLDDCARHAWNLILEHHRDPRNRGWDGDWLDLRRRIKVEGWTASVLREFREVARPRVDIRPPFGRGELKPPSQSWDDTRLGDLAQFEVKFLERHNDKLDIPEELLPAVFRILEDQLTVASGMLTDIETGYFRTPTCYPDREVDGKDYFAKAAKAMMWFVQLFDRLVDNSPELARAHATIWSTADRFFFRKLKLYTFSKVTIFEADYVAEAVLSLDQEAFWDGNVVRELLFLLVDRWSEFSEGDRTSLTDRILAGPNQHSHWSDEEFPGARDESAARYARYLELQGCDLTADRSKQLREMMRAIPRWSDGRATSTVTEQGGRAGPVRTDETPDAVIDLPVNEVVSKAKEDLKWDFGSFTERRPFTGLVKANPHKALSALTVAGKTDDYPQEFWTALINELPKDISPRLRRVFLHRLSRLPLAVIIELRHTLGRWLKQNIVAVLEFDDELGWAVFDRIVDAIMSGGADAAENSCGDVRQGGEVIKRSRRTYDHAINGPLGMCVEALFHAVAGEKPKPNSLIPSHIRSRVEPLFAAAGEGPDHAVSIAASKLDWLMDVDPDWTRERLIPMLAIDHPASEPAWNGFLSSGWMPSPPFTEVIKPFLLDVFPWIERFSWDRDLSEVAAGWLGSLRIFHPDEPGGLNRTEMRSALRAMSDDTRNQFISMLGSVGQHYDDGWAKHAIPFINEDWPRERRYRTSASMMAWIELLEVTGDNFPAVYEAVKKFLVPIETNEHPFYQFTREINDEEPLSARFPDATLDLMTRVTPSVLTRPPYELPKVLEVIAEADVKLTSDPRYLRLFDLVERS